MPHLKLFLMASTGSSVQYILEVRSICVSAMYPVGGYFRPGKRACLLQQHPLDGLGEGDATLYSCHPEASALASLGKVVGQGVMDFRGQAQFS